jgi:lysophospholipase L1-like esterase
VIECIVLGDSIAVGTQMQRPECVAYARGGINTKQWNDKFSDRNLTANTVIISLGTNDHRYVKTDKELLAMRAKVKASTVFWILPHDNLKGNGFDIEVIQIIVKDIAARYGDVILPITRISKDNIHPSTAGYKELAAKTKGN